MGEELSYTHVIFDVDGLLIDTTRLYSEAIQRVVSEYGKQYSWDLKVQCMGRKGHVSAALVIKSLQLPISVEEYLEKANSHYDELFPTANLLPGADALVRHLHKHKIPIALASGGSKESLELKTTNHKELFSLFHHSVLASSDPEVKNGKPAPDVFLLCAERFPDHPDPSKCLVFEDAPLGMQAGVAAGMKVIMVPDSRLSPHLTVGATQVLSSLEEFKPELYGLPKME